MERGDGQRRVIASLRQRHFGADIKQSRVSPFFIDGHLASVSGSLYDASTLGPHRAELPASDLHL